VEGINEIGNKIKKGINEAAEKIIWKAERPQRSSWFDEECQIKLEYTKRAYHYQQRNDPEERNSELTIKWLAEIPDKWTRI
jgi:hypothetical protein